MSTRPGGSLISQFSNSFGGFKTLCRPKGWKTKFLELTNFVLLLGPLYPDSESGSFPPGHSPQCPEEDRLESGHAGCACWVLLENVAVFLENFGLPEQ